MLNGMTIESERMCALSAYQGGYIWGAFRDRTCMGLQDLSRVTRLSVSLEIGVTI